MRQGRFVRRSVRVGARVAAATSVAAAVAVGATAGVTLAHNPSVQASCSELRVSAANYDAPATNNLLVVTIDGQTTSIPFGRNAAQTFPWDPLRDHTWTVVVDANREVGDPTRFDRTFSGTQMACPASTTTAPTTAPPTTAPPTSTPDVSTTAPSTDVTTTTEVGVGGPVPSSSTSTPDGTTTTTIVGVDAPVPGATSPAATPGRIPSAGAGSTSDAAAPKRLLPATGGQPWEETVLAGALLAVGLALVLVTRRGNPSPTPDA